MNTVRFALLLLLPLLSHGVRAEDELPLALQAAMAESMNIRLAASHYYFANGAMPSRLADVSFRPLVTTDVGAGGVVTLTLGGPDPDLAGKSLTLTPVISADGAIDWSCASATLTAEQLPPTCR